MWADNSKCQDGSEFTVLYPHISAPSAVRGMHMCALNPLNTNVAWSVIIHSLESKLLQYSRIEQFRIHWCIIIMCTRITLGVSLYKHDTRGYTWHDLNPLSPHDALKHHFTSLKTDLIFPQLRVFKLNFIESGLPIHDNFLYFFTHIKSSSSTTSRELRQQFAACSWWRWEWKVRLERVNPM